MSATNLAGKYRLIAELGQGGMATVYLAVVMGSSGFRKLAVVKLLRQEIAVDKEFVQMFLDEAKLCARLSHPNIVHTYDVGVDKFGHLIAMEYLDGVSLHAAVAKLGKKVGGPLTFPMQARILLDVLEGLRYAHDLKNYDGKSLDIVHRDVTPQNIYVTYDGQVKLLDFGIAKAATSSIHTATGVIKGKLTYMAPEQARGDPVDARADLYAVGVMLWEAVTGRRRWPVGLTQPALFTRLALGEPPESPDAASQGFPAEIDAVVMKSLAPDPNDRFQTATEFRKALETAMRGLEPVSLRDLGDMLAESFAAGRERMRNVIEEQFRAIDAGTTPSALHQVPTVASPSLVTSSEMFERPSPGRPFATPAHGQEVRVDWESQPPTARPPDPTGSYYLKKARSRRVAIIAGCCAVAVAGLAILVARSHLVWRGTEPVSSASPPPAAIVTPPSPRPPAADPLQENRTGDPTVIASDEARAAAARRIDVRARPVPVLTRPAPRGAGGRAPDETPSPTPAPPTPPEASSEATPLRIPQTKPKVQLERDNPWP